MRNSKKQNLEACAFALEEAKKAGIGSIDSIGRVNLGRTDRFQIVSAPGYGRLMTFDVLQAPDEDREDLEFQARELSLLLVRWSMRDE